MKIKKLLALAILLCSSTVFADGWSGRPTFTVLSPSDYSLWVTGGVNKTLTWTSLEANIKTYCDTLYFPYIANAQRGDMLFYGASGWSRLPKGTSTYILTQGTNDPEWDAPGGGSMTYPGAGVPVSTGSAWGTSLNITAISDSTSTTSSSTASSSTGLKAAYDLANGKLSPNGSAASLTNFPTLNQNTSGTAANLSGTPALPNGTTATTQTAADNTTKIATTAYADSAAAARQAALTYPVTGVVSPSAGYLTKWGASGNTLADGFKFGTMTDTKYCVYSTANGLVCNTTLAGGGDVTAASTSQTWGNGTGPNVWTFSVTGVDPTLTATDGLLKTNATLEAAAFQATKATGVAGDSGLYEANSTDTSAAGWRGPASLTYSYRGILPGTRAAGTNRVMAWTNGSESGSGTDTDPYLQTISWYDLGTLSPVAGSSSITTVGTVTSGNVNGALTDANVTGKLLTGFSSGAGTVAATDTILQAVNKLDGNITAKQASSAALTSLAGLTETNGGLPYGTADNTYAWLAAGAAGKVLQGNGAGAPSWSTPTYPSASGTARKKLVSDGTNIVYSTETWAVPGTSGNILQSDGTNWVATAPTGTGSPVEGTAPTITGQKNTVVTHSPSATGTVTLDCNAEDKAIITPTTASQADTIAFSNRPAAGSVHYMRIQIVAPASGSQTIVWPTSNVSWLGGTSGILTALAASKHYEYVCEIENTNTFCMINSEAAY